MTASEVLSVALSALADRRLRTPCQNPRTRDRWTADNHEDREYAVAACRPCPVLALCRQAADELKATYHVWGGTDRTVTPTRPKRAS